MGFISVQSGKGHSSGSRDILIGQGFAIGFGLPNGTGKQLIHEVANRAQVLGRKASEFLGDVTNSAAHGINMS